MGVSTQDVAWEMTAKIVFAPRKLQSNQHETLHISKCCSSVMNLSREPISAICALSATLMTRNFAAIASGVQVDQT
jgi:hypothetical protein